MLVHQEEILQLIPQRPPMVMVDKLISVADNITISGFTILPDNIFVIEEKLSEPGIIENIAQSAALGVGYRCRQNNEKIPIGYIGAIKNLEIYFLPEIGLDISTEIHVDFEVMNATLITGKVFCNQKPVAKCEMKIFLKND